jgi:ABC-type spermidine/putrescine transport system permease subunit II
MFAVAVLSLGELGAGKLVETPGSQTFAHEVFTQMHYGVTNDLAALCLVLLTVVIVGGSLFYVPLLSTASQQKGKQIVSQIV